MSLATLLVEHPFDDDDPLVHTADVSFTKSQIVSAVTDLAGDIERRGIAGTGVGIVADGVDALVGMFACWMAETVYVPVNPRQPADAIRDACERAEVSLVVRDGEILSERHDRRHADGAAFVVWTSGTTGAPKPIIHSHDAYLELIDRVLAPLRGKAGEPERPPSPNLIPVSMALNAGIYNALFGLRAGAPLVVMDRFTTSDFATLVERHEVRSTVLPPAAIAMLNDDTSIADLGPLRYVRSITAPLSPFQARRFSERFGVFVLNGYGQAEMGEVIGWTAADARAHPQRVGAVGRPHPGVEIAIDEPDDHGIGELLVRPPNVALDIAPERLDDVGFVRTGDLARVDDAGFVWIEGRRSDLINRGGNKVFPDEVEEVITAGDGVVDAAVVGAPDERLGEVPVAFVVGDVSEDLAALCRAHLAPYKVPVRFERVDSLPRNAAGKLLRRELAP